MTVRAALGDEIGKLALLWHEGWQDAHAAILPRELAELRTLASFQERLQSNFNDLRVVGAPGEPLGLCIIKDIELYQLYVSRSARGQGVASALLVDAEQRIGAQGSETAWLACAIGNDRAARFYEKHGWVRVGNMINRLKTPRGEFPLKVWRYEKILDPGSSRPTVGVAHVLMHTSRMPDTCRFMRLIGMRPIFDGPELSVYEMRGGTHLILMRRDAVPGGDAAFDLMVDDLHATHARLASLGLAPSPIEARPAIDHEVFTVREPSGNVITIFSSHASGSPT
jgi:ribosomal protein S18 acetylase RimI-like enzyme